MAFPVLPYFFSTSSHKRYDPPPKKVIEHEIGASIFSTTFAWNNFRAKKNSARYVQGGAKRTHVFESACDFFLWGYLKSEVYVRKPRTVDDLKVSIREEIATVPQEILVNVM